MGFFSRQASYGPPAQAPFIEQPVELEAQAEAYKKMADISYTKELNLPETPYVKRTTTDPNTPTLYEQYYNLVRSNYNEQFNSILEEVDKSSGKLTLETKEKLSKVLKGRIFSEETKKKMS